VSETIEVGNAVGEAKGVSETVGVIIIAGSIADTVELELVAGAVARVSLAVKVKTMRSEAPPGP
jgi:formylmethanofuran dehydrogenase subunit C